MSEVIKIVLTGGPCAGKSSAIKYVEQRLEADGFGVVIIEECATKLFLRGISPEKIGNYEFHKQLFGKQLDEETRAYKQAALLHNDRAVVLSDRGLLDSRAYVTEDEFSRYAGEYNLNEDKIRNSYDAVFHLVTAANGAENFYTTANNTVRSENIEKARNVDENTISVWTGTPHLRVIDNSTDFEGKIERLIAEIEGFLGLPEPLEIERKFLIEYPDLNYLNSIKTCRKTAITQAYLTTPEEGNFRIRKRGEGDKAVYIKTVKIKISDIRRVEIENYISEKEYYNYLSRKECVTGVISKDRYCIVWNSTYYELDVYPFWNDRATLEIELLNEEQAYKLPEFVKLIREVTFEKEYRNLALAQKFGSKLK